MTKKSADHDLEPEFPLPERKLPKNWKFPVFEKTIGIAVSGDVRVTKLELDIIDTPDFQRLKGVRQLGAAVQVYPTAVHTRFDHSLGTLAMVDRMIIEIRDRSNKYNVKEESESKITDEERAIARLYALLHDISHVPFGHTLEDEFGIFTAHDNPQNKRLEKFLGRSSAIGQLILEALAEENYKRFMSLYVPEDVPEANEEEKTKEEKKLSEFWKEIGPPKPDDKFIYDLVSNTVCADLLDYLERDSYFCNLRIDLEYRFLKFLYLGEHKGERRVLVRLWKGTKNVPRDDVLTDLVRLLEARYMIAERVYFHHAKIIAGTMIARAAQEAAKQGSLDDAKLRDFTDDTLVNFLATNKKIGKAANRLALAYKERRLYKCACEYRKEYFAKQQVSDHTSTPRKSIIKRLGDPDVRLIVENKIANDIGAEPGDVLLYVPRAKMNNKVHDALVLWNGVIGEFREIDAPSIEERLRANEKAHERLWRINLLLRPELFDDEEARSDAYHSFKEKIIDIVDGDGAEDARKDQIAHVIRHRVCSVEGLPPIPPAEHERRVLEAAKDYVSVQRAGSPGGRRITRLIGRHWPKSNDKK